MPKPVNGVVFTIDILQKMREFIDQEVVSKHHLFCDYDKQALEDAAIYLQNGPVKSIHHENLDAMVTFMKEINDQSYHLLCQIVHTRDFQQATYKLPSIEFGIDRVALDVVNGEIRVRNEERDITTFDRNDVAHIVFGERYLTVVLDNGGTLSIELRETT
jgi:hypothetical protein